jgi:hypothetical protein
VAVIAARVDTPVTPSVELNAPVVKDPAAAVVPPMTVPSMVPALMSAVVATRDAMVPNEVTLGCAAVCSVPVIAVIVTAAIVPPSTLSPLI